MQRGHRECWECDCPKILSIPRARAVCEQAAISASLSKGSYYYEPKGESEYNEAVMKEIDRIHTENPARGVMGMVMDLVALNFIVGPKRVRR